MLIVIFSVFSPSLGTIRQPSPHHLYGWYTQEVTAAQGEGAPGRCLVDRLAPGGELGPNGRPDEIGAVGVEALLDQQIDLAEVDQPHVDSDLLSLLSLTRNHPPAISSPSIRMVYTGKAALQPVVLARLDVTRGSTGYPGVQSGRSVAYRTRRARGRP